MWQWLCSGLRLDNPVLAQLESTGGQLQAMSEPTASATRIEPPELLLPSAAEAAAGARPVWLVGEELGVAQSGLPPASQAWLEAVGYKPSAKAFALLPEGPGAIAGAVLGLGRGQAGEPCGPSALLAGALPGLLPKGAWRLEGQTGGQAGLATIAWGLGAYRFQRYKSATPGENRQSARLVCPNGVDRARALAIIDAVWLGRDLINTPAADMGPAELAAAASHLALRHGAAVTTTVGRDLLTHNFPMTHAVGRASPREPRMIDIVWGHADAPKVTLVGKGICFDTGGLDLKPSSAMLLMKKDMGGAATALSLAHMIMAAGLDVRLRVLIPAAENSVSGNSYRPLDVITTRSGKTVEIGNTDAEGRLVLSDALTLADEEAPDTLLTFSTLTGAARVALGPDLPPLYTDDDAFAAEVTAAGLAVGDPVWRMPFWAGYERNLDSEVADMGNVADGPFAGSVIAALFLRRFVSRARRFAHFDIYGWRQAPRPLGPKGGEPQTARALFSVLEKRFPARR
jgi:leucyl aminopeptidase